ERVGQSTADASQRWVQALDVARYLHQGENVLAVEAEGTALLAELSDNSTVVYARTLVTDTTWKTASRPEPGWQTQTFDDSAWQPARAVAEYGKGEPGWQNLVWESALQEHFRYQANRVFPTPSRNQRDNKSQEGFPLFDAALAPADQLR